MYANKYIYISFINSYSYYVQGIIDLEIMYRDLRILASLDIKIKMLKSQLYKQRSLLLIVDRLFMDTLSDH